MSDEDALLKAIIASAGDDTPRLVYADWLDEHEAPLQAEFIRAHCRLARCTAADPGYPDALERAQESAIRFGLAARLSVPQLPPGFVHEGFRRGFPSSASADWNLDAHPYYGTLPPTDEQIERVCAGLGDLVTNTTIRHLVLRAMSPDALTRILSVPAAQALTGLTVYPDASDPGAGDALVRALSASKVMANLEHLELFCNATVTGLSALKAAPGRLSALVGPALFGSAQDISGLVQCNWFRELREAQLRSADRSLQRHLLVALANLPHLEAFNIQLMYSTATFMAFRAAGGFPELARLEISG